MCPDTVNIQEVNMLESRARSVPVKWRYNSNSRRSCSVSCFPLYSFGYEIYAA